MRRFSSALALAVLAAHSAATVKGDQKLNPRPGSVAQNRAGTAERNTAVGPFWFSQPVASGTEQTAVRAHGFRPFYIATTDAQGTTTAVYSLYPFFSYHADGQGTRWSVFQLINHASVHDLGGRPGQQTFDLWPFYFSANSGSAESSYHAVLPFYGAVKHRFGMDRLSWVSFPLYAKWEKNDVTTLTTPWPLIKILHGQDNHGFEFWPLAGFREKPGVYRRQFYLWPLIYKQEQQLWAPQPEVKRGFLPFYAEAKSNAFHSETFLWPFFGYTDRTAPSHYHEVDYLWPIWVQGRGENRWINRWGPFFTHSVVNGTDKRWMLWPLWRRETFREGALQHTKRQFLYFLFNDIEQKSAINPALPTAHRTNVWPLFTWWDNGAGRKQFQAFSPLEVFFPTNNPMRLSYSDFFAIYRYNRISSNETEHSLLWNLFTFHRTAQSREFQFGPLLSKAEDRTRSSYEIGNGLLALERRPGRNWHFSFFAFKSARQSSASINPG